MAGQEWAAVPTAGIKNCCKLPGRSDGGSWEVGAGLSLFQSRTYPPMIFNESRTARSLKWLIDNAQQKAWPNKEHSLRHTAPGRHTTSLGMSAAFGDFNQTGNLPIILPSQTMMARSIEWRDEAIGQSIRPRIQLFGKRGATASSGRV